jgi:hypothetical protein
MNKPFVAKKAGSGDEPEMAVGQLSDDQALIFKIVKNSIQNIGRVR